MLSFAGLPYGSKREDYKGWLKLYVRRGKITMPLCCTVRAFCVRSALIAGMLAGCLGPSVVAENRLQRALELVETGSASLRQGKLDDASAMFSVAAELAPIAAAIDGQGCVALLRGDLTQAEQLFRQAYEMDGAYDEALANWALVLELSGRVAEAKELYNQAVERLPGHVGARNNRAVLEYDTGAAKMFVLQELNKAGLITQNGVVNENIGRMKGK